MAITATLGANAAHIYRGGGRLWIVAYDATKDPKKVHATLDAAAIATATTLSCYRAVTTEFGATGSLAIDVFAKDAAAEEKAFSALATSDFTIAALTTARTVGAIVKLKGTDDYAVTDWKNLGHLAAEGTELQDSTPAEYSYNELNEMVGAFDGERTIQFITGLMQTSRDMIDFLRDEARGNYYAVKYVVPIVGGGHQIYVAEMCKLIPDLKLKFAAKAERNIALTIAILKKTDTSTPLEVYEG